MGLVLEGERPARVLIRAIGPSLNAFGVTQFLADPKLELFQGSTPLKADDDGESADPFPEVDPERLALRPLRPAEQAAGAFPRPATSADAALVTTLEPGSYTAAVTGVNGAADEVLVEVFIPP